MTTWYVPVVLVLVFCIVAWQSRNVVRTGEVEIRGFKVDEAERPALFWWIVFANVFAMAALVFCLVVWIIDFKGLRS